MSEEAKEPASIEYPLTLEGFKSILETMLKSNLPMDLPLEEVENEETFVHHHWEWDISDGAYLLEDNGKLNDVQDIDKMTLSEIVARVDSCLGEAA